MQFLGLTILVSAVLLILTMATAEAKVPWWLETVVTVVRGAALVAVLATLAALAMTLS